MVNRKGYFFVVDAMIAATILFLGLFYLFSVSIVKPESTQSFTTAQDFTTILLSQPLYTSTNNYYVSTLLTQGLVPYPDATPAEEIAYLNYLGCASCSEYAYNFTKSFADESLEQRYGVSLSVNGTLIYNRTTKKAIEQVGRQAIMYVRMNSTNLTGPIIAEVLVWY